MQSMGVCLCRISRSFEEIRIRPESLLARRYWKAVKRSAGRPSVARLELERRRSVRNSKILEAESAGIGEELAVLRVGTPSSF